jgi:plastocyanin
MEEISNLDSKEDKEYSKKPIWKMVIVYLVIGIIVYLLAYYLIVAKRGVNNGPLVSNPSGSITPTVTPSSTPTPNLTNTQAITVRSNEFAFDPSTVTVQSGKPVTLTFINGGNYPHDLRITDLNMGTEIIRAGEQTILEFTPINPGQFMFICTVPGHADQGMKGNLIVQ